MDVSRRKKLAAVYEATRFRPRLGVAIVILSFGTALLEGVGLGFLLPIIEIARSSSSPTNSADGIFVTFVRIYEFLGFPFTLEYLIGGVAAVMTVRFGLSFVTSWLRATLGRDYQRYLRQRLFNSLMYGPIEYIDQSGTDELLNSLITETRRSAGIVMSTFSISETVLRGLVYITVATIIAPTLTIIALVSLGASTLLVRYILEPAYAVGDEVADVNDQVQRISQSGLQGMRDIRLFNMRSEMIARMEDVLGKYVSTGVRLQRNQAALNNFNQLMNALVVFGLVYVGFQFTDLSLARLGVFLFAVFRVSPVVNQINNSLYRLDGQLPNLIRVRERWKELEEQHSAVSDGERPIRAIRKVEFDNVSFRYQDELVLENVSFSVKKGEKIALVGPSGAGKSTVVALLGRLQTPASGSIGANGTPINEFDVEQWRSRLAIVRQNPFLFNGSLWENVTIGNRDASRSAVKQACEVAQVTEFLSDLPEGYETELGEDGVRLSGGQKQRVAIARALLKDADVLVLDEATSELDSNIEREVYRGIKRMNRQYARITIAHRLSTVNDADRILTIADGEVMEVGTHEELLDSDGTYAKLYTAQDSN